MKHVSPERHAHKYFKIKKCLPHKYIDHRNTCKQPCFNALYQLKVTFIFKICIGYLYI